MVTVLTVIVVVVLVCAGPIYHFRNRPAFAAGVAVTLALWGAPFVLSPSYANALYVILGLIGSAVLGLLGIGAWWRSRRDDADGAWFWLVGGALAAAPAVVLVGYRLFVGGA